MNRFIAVLACTLVLVGCGGGGSSSSEPAAPPSATTGSGGGTSSGSTGSGSTGTGDSGDTPAPVSQTSDLVAAQSFLFRSSFAVEISVNVAANHPDADYITVCLPSASDPGEPDLGNCLIRSELDAGQFASTAQVTGDTSRLFTVLWDFAQPNAPSVSSFEISPEANSIDLI